jgi:hypothetical protein
MHLYIHWVRERRKKLKKAMISGTKKDNSSTEIRRSWYQSIDKKHIWVNVKFGGRLSIPFRRKKRFKKVGLFLMGGMLQTEPSGQNQPAYPEFC